MTYDALVVGAGLTGSMVARRLSERMRVALLDAGPLLDGLGAGGRRRIRLDLPRRAWAIATGRASLAFSKFPPQAWPLFVDPRQHPYTVARGTRFAWWRGRQVGGRGHTWGRTALRMSDRQLVGGGPRGDGWPITAADLAPYYAMAEADLEVIGTPEGIADVPDGAYVRDAVLREHEARFREEVQRRWPVRRVIPLRLATYAPHPVPPSLRALPEDAQLDLISDAVVRRLATDDSGQVVGVEICDRETGEISVIEGRTIALAASSLETVRILLNSHGRAHPGGLGNSSGNLGRYVMDHVRVWLHGRLPGVGGVPTAVDPLRMWVDGGVYLPAFRGQECEDAPLDYGVQAWLWGSGDAALVATGEALPRWENHVRLDPCVLDAWGVPALRIDVRWSAEELRTAEDQRATVRELLACVGGRSGGSAANWIGNLLSHRVAPPGAAIHESGGARMGADPRTSVVDPECRLWDAPNVVVCDAAAFPTSGYQNTTLTAVALAARAADGIARRAST